MSATAPGSSPGPREHTELWIVRHADAAAGHGTVTGQLDVPLTATGHAQAARLAKRLTGMRFAALYSSDLQRAVATAGYLSSALALQTRLDARLRELHAGTWTGMTEAEIAAAHPEDWAAWQRRDPDRRRGGGQGESYRLGADRITTACSAIAERHPGERVLVVSHSAVMGLYLANLMGLDLVHACDLPLMNTSVTRVRPFMPIDGERRSGQVVVVNDVAHLEG